MDKETRNKVKSTMSKLMTKLVEHPLFSDSKSLQDAHQKVYEVYIICLQEEINDQ